MRILYLGSSRGTSLARFESLNALGYKAELLDPALAIPDLRVARSWSARTGGFGFEARVRRFVLRRVGSMHYDVAFVDSGELVSRDLLKALRGHARVIVNYNPDNPYRGRDGHRWRLFRGALREYDMLFVPRVSNVEDARQEGAKNVHRVWFSADDQLKDSLPSGAAQVGDEVVFVGTWMPERGALLLRLIELGVPLKIYGPRWDRAPEYKALKSHIHLGYLRKAEYEFCIASSKIAVALLSKGNKDLHTTRSIEIPLLKSVLCAERTAEHLQMYTEGKEAVFWSSPEECANLCLQLLADDHRLRLIADAGRARAIQNGHFDSRVMSEMIRKSLSLASCGSSGDTEPVPC